MLSGTRSLLLLFASLDGTANTVTLGAVIRDRDADDKLEPGRHYGHVELVFWADDARIYATVGEPFEAWYNGRTVGRGKVTAILEDWPPLA